VIAIVPANRDPRMVRIGDYNLSRLPPFSSSRDHESYLIQVGKSKRLYWPLVKYLKRDWGKVSLALDAKVIVNPWEIESSEIDDPMMPGEGCGSDD